MKSTHVSRLFSEFYYRLFHDENMLDGHTEKNLLLEKADIHMGYREYRGFRNMLTIITTLLSSLSGVIVFLLLPGFPWFFLMIIVVFTSFSPWFFYSYYPQYLVAKRGQNIDRHLPYAVNYINIVSSTGVAPVEIFRSLSRLDLYGEIKNEAKKISKEIDSMGVDNITAMKHGIERSPSKKFKAFLQGLIGTIQSGNSLQLYLSKKTEEYMKEDMRIREKNMETLGLIAEMFVVTAIAFPIFLVIILTVFGFIGRSAVPITTILFILSFGILPLAFLGFYVLIKSTMIEDIEEKHESFFNMRKNFLKNKELLRVVLLSTFSLIVFLASVLVFYHVTSTSFNTYHIMDLLFISTLILIGPYSVYSYLDLKKKNEIQERFPDFLIDAGNSVSSGMNVFDAIKESSRGNYGCLTPEIKKMKIDLSWNIPIKETLYNFSQRIKNSVIKRIVFTINKGLFIGGDVANVFRASAEEVKQINNAYKQRIATMSMYTVIIMMSFFVFLFVLFVLDKTLFTYFLSMNQSEFETMQSFVSTVDPVGLHYSLYSFAFIQSIGSGMVGGYMRNGTLNEGLRYSFLLGLISIVVFNFLI